MLAAVDRAPRLPEYINRRGPALSHFFSPASTCFSASCCQRGPRRITGYHLLSFLLSSCHRGPRRISGYTSAPFAKRKSRETPFLPSWRLKKRSGSKTQCHRLQDFVQRATENWNPLRYCFVRSGVPALFRTGREKFNAQEFDLIGTSSVYGIEPGPTACCGDGIGANCSARQSIQPHNSTA